MASFNLRDNKMAEVIYPIYIPLCFYFIPCRHISPASVQYNLHSTMLLLYHLRIVCQLLHFLHLHSTMLLLYLRCQLFYFRIIRNLHSTMLLLYPGFVRSVAFWYAHLHSTMLLLYRFPLVPAAPVRDNLHSTMLLLSLIASTVLPLLSVIYIPLCFYFIRDTITVTRRE